MSFVRNLYLLIYTGKEREKERVFIFGESFDNFCFKFNEKLFILCGRVFVILLIRKRERERENNQKE